MNRYSKGQIYKIIDNDYNLCYIGSTCESLSKRFERHKAKYRRVQKGHKMDTTSFVIFDKYGIDNCKIEWIEDYPCDTRKELQSREGYYIERSKCVNRYIAGRTREEWLEEHQEQYKASKAKHYQHNKEQYKDRAKQHRLNNPEHCKEVKRQYQEKNKDKIKETHKTYYENNKHKWDRYKEQYTCECGSVLALTSKSDHLKSKKHQAYLANINSLKMT